MLTNLSTLMEGSVVLVNYRMAGNIGEELLLANWRSATKSPIKNLPILINSLLGVASGFTRACVKKQCFDTSRRLTKTQHLRANSTDNTAPFSSKKQRTRRRDFSRYMTNNYYGVFFVLGFDNCDCIRVRSVSYLSFTRQSFSQKRFLKRFGNMVSSNTAI